MIADRQRMLALARSFPELARRAPLGNAFDPEALDAWAISGAPGHGGSCAARFVLSVWTGYTGALDVGREPGRYTWPWQAERFDLHEALACWDDAHRAAFLAWARAPWWP